ncbi:MAG: amino acid permease [Proteobacteria bacterium]|nr:amino acid permease [Pseudomonadota bacterium]
MSARKSLGLLDLVLFNTVAIVGLRWVALAGHSGPSSLTLWLLAALAFFIPQGLCVMTLSSALPKDGGLYVWIREAFGERQGFIAGWLYWASNILYFPTLCLSTVVFALYIFNDQFVALENSHVFAAGASLILLGVALGCNIAGTGTGRWLQNLGGLAQWLPSLVLIGVGLVALVADGSATPMPAASLVPTFSNLDTIIFFSQICFAFAGLELAPVLAGEIREPRRTIPRALLISGFVIAGIYLFNTLALMWALPAEKISIIAGVNQAIAQAGAAHGMPWLGPPVALLMTLAGIGALGAWLIGSARLLFVGGMDRLLPPALARVHPRWNTPYVALLVQGGLATVFILAATQGASVRTAYLIMVDATAILNFIVYLYLFASALKLRARIGRMPEAIAIPGGVAGSLVSNGLGFVATLGAIVLALVPPSDTGDKWDFFLKVIGGAAGFIVAGLALYWLAKRRAMRT